MSTHACMHGNACTHLVLRQRAPHEDDDSLTLVLVLPVLESELRDLDRGSVVALGLDLDVAHAIQHFAQILRRRHKNPRGLASHGEHAHGVLGMALSLSSGEQVHGIRLGQEARRSIVPTAGPLAVVNQNNGALQHGVSRLQRSKILKQTRH